jgi:undecaprenyl-diphosphatase
MEDFIEYDNPRFRKKVEIIDLLIAMFVLALAIISLLNYNFFRTKATTEILLYGKLGIFLVGFILDLIPQIFDTAFIFFIAMATSTGLFSTTLFILLGSAAGGLLGYEIGRKYGFRFISPLFSKKIMKKTIQFWDKYGKFYVFLSVWSFTPLPYFPLIFGALGMKRKDFWAWGIIPRMLNFIVFALAIHFGIVLWQGL